MQTITRDEEMISLSKEEYEDMQEYMERLRETVTLLNDKEEMQEIKEALSRIESGEFLTEKDVLQ